MIDANAVVRSVVTRQLMRQTPLVISMWRDGW
jgi:hypothetical protein